MNTTTNQKMTVNGKAFTVTKASDKTVELVGPRGGHAALIKNIHSGAWVLIVFSGRNPRTYAIDSLEVV